MSEEVVYAVRNAEGKWLYLLRHGNGRDWLGIGEAYFCDDREYMEKWARETGGEVVALVPLTDAQRRDLQAMEELRKWGGGLNQEGQMWVSAIGYKRYPKLLAADPAEAILAAAAKLRREARP